MEPFDGLFGSRGYDFKLGFQWDFFSPDLNDSAKSTVSRLDRVFEIVATPGVSPTIDQRSKELLASFPHQNDSNE